MLSMETRKPSSLLLTTLTIFFCILQATSDPSLENFQQCLLNHSQHTNPISEAIYTPTNSSFSSLLLTRISNRRYSTPSTPKPLAIVPVKHESHLQATIICAKSHGLQVRVRSGGHDYEGLSYVSQVPFVVLDKLETAWVQSGATIGELYYSISQRSNVHGFPAGACPTVGTGGHFSGGGYGNMMRKYGLTVDNVIDAELVDVNGRILDRKSMGEDVFWAICGGGGASFWSHSFMEDQIVFWTVYPIGSPIEVLLAKHKAPQVFFKSRSDYAKKPIPKTVIENIWDLMIKGEKVWMQWNPYGGRMHEISASATPFPHRAWNLFLIQYYTFWTEEGIEATNHYMNFSRYSTPKPLAIIAAKHESRVQATIICAQPHGLQVRIRSGGHDYEGLSYVSQVPFVVLDMFNLRSIHINLAKETTWIQSGAMIELVDINGRILDRKSMGEDVFGAICVAGGASFGVILSWKSKLVSVPLKVTVFHVKKTIEEGATDVVYQWQLVATKLHEDLFIRVMLEVVNGTQEAGKKTIQVSFVGQFLGQIDSLSPLVNESFPELGLQKSDCIEMPWVNSSLLGSIPYWEPH
ncbi:hypothetical protein L6164_032758 [Bauhinia variegata]|uniref:Uncharacterized protein n=1 Tax=Bauhinia variegata TaxID=167791 RepID=A0ACB9KPL5_BAUVA|nr:hypothetical protein L6164_032758 [Bauhinia variegata]